MCIVNSSSNSRETSNLTTVAQFSVSWLRGNSYSWNLCRFAPFSSCRPSGNQAQSLRWVCVCMLPGTVFRFQSDQSALFCRGLSKTCTGWCQAGEICNWPSVLGSCALSHTQVSCHSAMRGSLKEVRSRRSNEPFSGSSPDELLQVITCVICVFLPDNHMILYQWSHTIKYKPQTELNMDT